MIMKIDDHDRQDDRAEGDVLEAFPLLSTKVNQIVIAWKILLHDFSCLLGACSIIWSYETPFTLTGQFNQ